MEHKGPTLWTLDQGKMEHNGHDEPLRTPSCELRDQRKMEQLLPLFLFRRVKKNI